MIGIWSLEYTKKLWRNTMAVVWKVSGEQQFHGNWLI
jgi:hypothetical protein